MSLPPQSVSHLAAQAGPNGPQVEWFFQRLEAFGREDWFHHALGSQPGDAKVAMSAIDIATEYVAEQGLLEMFNRCAGIAYAVAKAFNDTHFTVMGGGALQAVGSLRLRTAEEVTQAFDAAVLALQTMVQTGAIALATRPFVNPSAFEAIWQPWEQTLGLLAVERGRLDTA